MSSQEKIFKRYDSILADDISIVQESTSVYARSFYDLVDISELNKNVIAEKIIHINIKTIQRYLKENLPLSAMNGELVLKLIGLYRIGLTVFSTVGHFNSWLSKSAHGLGGSVPMDFLKTSTGIDLVKDELLRIQYGATA